MPLSTPGFNREMSTISTLSDLLTIDEMCKFLGISPKTGYRLIKGGEIKAIKVGRSYRIPKQHLLEFLGIWEVQYKD